MGKRRCRRWQARSVRYVVTLALAMCFVSTGFAGSAIAGEDTFYCNDSSSDHWCLSRYDHHSRWIQAWYEGTGNLPLAGGSYYTGGWIYYTDSSIYGGYNFIRACYYFECNVNSGILGLFNWRNLHTSRHTVWGRENF